MIPVHSKARRPLLCIIGRAASLTSRMSPQIGALNLYRDAGSISAAGLASDIGLRR